MPKLIGPVLPAGTLGERPQPVLALDELRLRPWEGADADQLVDAYADPAIQRWHGQSMTRTEALAWIEDRARQAALRPRRWAI